MSMDSVEGDRAARGELRGRELLANRFRNKATAFTEAERDRYGLRGLLPPIVEDLATQVRRVDLEYAGKATDLDRHIYLRLLQQRNSVLFYRYLADHLADLLPIVYTPTVGLACQEWSRIYRREHGLYVSLDDRGRVRQLLDNAITQHEEVRVVVVTDGERILGLGDLGVGGMGIPIGKLALYTAVGGLAPETTLPVALDVGTDNEALLSDPLYLGLRRRRERGPAYDELVDELIAALRERCPGVLLQWEDFAQHNAGRLLARHRGSICSFNDDIQGTAGVTAAAVMAGMRISDQPLAGLRAVIVGAGSAGVGIARQLVACLIRGGVESGAARSQVWLVDKEGLLRAGHASVLPFQEPFARATSDVAGWATDIDGRIPLVEVVRRSRPHALIGVTGQPGLFTEDTLRAMAAGVARPIVMPLSNPTLRAEAIPADVLSWTEGRALVGTGSPFAPVDWHGRSTAVPQVNNVYVFPGVGLGVVASEASQVTDDMITAACLAVAEAAASHGLLVPPIEESPEVAEVVALAVARQAVADGVAPARDDDELAARIAAARWRPEYS